MNLGKRLASVALASMIGGGALLTAPVAAEAAVAERGASTAAGAVSTAPAESSCLWRYVVTDGVYNDVLVYDGHSSENVVERIHPGEYFTSSNPPHSVAGRHGVRLEITGGWVGLGDWTQLQRCGDSPGPLPPITVDPPMECSAAVLGQ